MYGMMEIRAENSYKRLKRELDCCPYITGIEREWLTAYLLQHRIVSLNEIDLKKEMEYRSFVWDSEEIVESKKVYYAGALESCLLSYRQGLPEYQELLEELKTCRQFSRPVHNKVLHFLLIQGIHHIHEIDYKLRQQFDAYLKETHCKKPLEYIKALDCLKLQVIQNRSQNRKFEKPRLAFREEPIFLLYHPDYETAMKFYYLQNKEEAVFDFALSAARKLKKQIFSMLMMALEKKMNRKNRRELYLVPLKKLYLYCAEQGIEDLEALEEEEIEGFRESMDGRVGTKTQIYMQIVDNTRKHLFLCAKETNWEANVWYLERFQMKGERMNPADPVESLRFYGIHDLENRKYLKKYMRYCLGITSKAVHTIRVEHYNICRFLQYCDRKGWKVNSITEKEMGLYFLQLENSKIQAETFNQQVADLHLFFQYLVVKGSREKIPFWNRYYLKKTLPVHYDRVVSEEVLEKLLLHLKYFPEHLRLMYLHLFCLGLRVNEVCCIRGDAYSWNGQDAWLRIYQYKVKVDKQIPIPAVLYRQMVVYIQKHRIGPEEFVFHRKDGRAYHVGTFCVQVKALCQRYGISCGDYIFRSHDYRHRMGTKLYAGGASVQAVRDYLGPVHENMTRQYLDLIPETIDQANENYFQKESSLGNQFLMRKEL